MNMDSTIRRDQFIAKLILLVQLGAIALVAVVGMLAIKYSFGDWLVFIFS